MLGQYWAFMGKLLNPIVSFSRTLPFILEILPDTYQHLQLIYSKYEDKVSALDSNDYFKIFIENHPSSK